ncbi:MAG TPA: hypothetical protein VF554_10615 [Thermoanaerobaculia bacterium]
MNAPTRIVNGTYELLAVASIASLLSCARREDPPAPRPALPVSPGAPRLSPAAIRPAPGMAKGGISFVALPNADIRVFAAGTPEEVPLPGHTTPLFISVAPGIYRVELTFPGARPAARNVTVEPGHSIAVHVEDPRSDVEKLVAAFVPEAGPASETRIVLRNGIRSFFRGDYDGSVKTLSGLSDAGNETARIFTAYAMAGSVLAGGREAGPELPRARALFESVPAQARPTKPPGVSSRILEALAVPAGHRPAERSP